MMDNPVPQLYGTRYYYEQPKYYPYGNRQPNNYLQYTSPVDTHEPKILAVGCGDFRSVAYTIWKNFNPDFDHIFSGAEIVLNDKSPAVLAKNVLFFYLCLTLPEEDAPKLKRLQAMWSIWCCYELLPEHKKVLQDSLKVLSKYADDWFNDSNELLDLITFATPGTLASLKKYWSYWQTFRATDSVKKQMRKQRKTENDDLPTSVHGVYVSELGLYSCTGLVGRQLNEEMFERMQQEYQVYMLNGVSHSEILTEESISQSTIINPTMFTGQEEAFRILATQTPFRCFYQVHVSSIEQNQDDGMYTPDFPHIEVSTEAFEKNPLLANSFQQFSLWISCTFEVLKFDPWKISLKLSCMNILEYFCDCTDKYDVIYATNVSDHLAPPPLILGAINLLKTNGIFVSGTIQYRHISPTVEDYIETIFGFPPKYLPVICGIRCLNHEGDGYSSLVSTEHFCVETDAITSFEVKAAKILLWKKVTGTHYSIQSLSESPGPDIATCLAKMFRNCSRGHQHPDHPVHSICIDTGIKILLAFAAQFEPKAVSSYQFWSQLCSELKEDTIIKSYRHSIQNQALVSGLHLHLTVDKSTCPLCMDIPLSGYLGQFRVVIPVEKLFKTRPYFGAFVFAHDENGGQTLDCVTGKLTGQTLTISFLAPLCYVRKAYKFIFDEKCVNPPGKGNPRSVEILEKGSIGDYLVSGPLIPRPKSPSDIEKPTSSNLGTVTKHFGNAESFETVIKLAEDKPDLLTAKLDIGVDSECSVKTVCANHSLNLVYPFPVASHKLHLQRSRRDRTLTIKAHRRGRKYEEEGTLFYVNPEDHYALPAVQLGPEMIEFFTRMQYSHKMRVLYGHKVSVNHSMLEVESAVTKMLTKTDRYVFSIESERGETMGVIEVINLVVDVERKIPAVYLSYVFVSDLNKDGGALVKKAVDVIDDKVSLRFSVGGLELLKKLLDFFNNHNLSAFETKTVILNELEDHCRNAVVYPFYQDPCRGGQSLQCANCLELINSDYSACLNCNAALYCKTECRDRALPVHMPYCRREPLMAKHSAKIKSSSQGSPHTICSYCRKMSFELKSCAKCRKAAYCGRECQKAHWKAHKRVCVQDQPCCSNCKTAGSDLKKCTGCEKVSYCSKQCQLKHWSKHKKDCTGSTNGAGAPASKSTKQKRTERTAGKRSEELKQRSARMTSKKPSDQQHSTSKVKSKEPSALSPDPKQAEPVVKTKPPTDIPLVKPEPSSKGGSKKSSPVENGHDFVKGTSKKLTMTCGYCQKKPTKPQRCARCHKVVYCGQDCQRAHWKAEHKLTCNTTG